MDTVLAIGVGVAVLLFGGAIIKAVNDCQKGFPNTIDVDEVKNKLRDRYYLQMTIRPQIFLAIATLGIITLVSLYLDSPEVATGCTAGIIALAMKVIDND